MSFILQPWQFLLISLAGWINRQQQRTIEYLITENHVLREKVGSKRILLNDDQRRRLAVKGRLLDRKLLQQVATIVTPDTILRWHRQLFSRPMTTGTRRPGAAQEDRLSFAPQPGGSLRTTVRFRNDRVFVPHGR
ncbi:hypothetical protein ACFLU6_04310 [Acidobacteriota bacterium]